jgi:hypothetical protein
MLDIDHTWAMAAAGEQLTYAVEAMRNDGSDWQRLIAIEFPARLNKTDERVTLRLLVDPLSAEVLADNLMHTARWLKALAELEDAS